MDQHRDDLKHRLITMLGEYAAIDAVAGYEQDMVARLVADLEPHVDGVDVDPFGNVTATRRGTDGAPSLMVAAHSDEIGGVVKAIEPEGVIRFEKLGGVIETLLLGRAVRIRGHRGVIGAKAGHITPPAERLTAPPLRELYVDLGFDTRAEVEALGIQVGDPIAYEAPMRALANPDRLSGKALDNRVGCAIVVELARRLAGVALGCTVHFVVTTQEEIGLRGARMVTYRLDPTAAIVIDTMPAGGTPDVSATKDLSMRIGAGPVVTLISQSGSGGIIVPPGMRDLLLRTAEQEGIPVQRALFYGGNADAAAVHLVRGGVPTGVVNIARRYSHSPVETLDANDAVDSLRLVEAAVRGFGTGTRLGFLGG
ncbi:MAG: beta-1,4-glucanase (cellulase) [uncultured Thermomicrobiales bacterium]|uniref:Beta-1,4-glucanase (Cellulase) n=1 Tax=uncultured Thermomicrobiales bacterium TaxID=1645740 RepID=A0A6J4ULE6_9BACT|nr:MAG: beta-1,4-glucanase (cellulase) [uncultured Thermomicrobiales bacterium]